VQFKIKIRTVERDFEKTMVTDLRRRI